MFSGKHSDVFSKAVLTLLAGDYTGSRNRKRQPSFWRMAVPLFREHRPDTCMICKANHTQVQVRFILVSGAKPAHAAGDGGDHRVLPAPSTFGAALEALFTRNYFRQSESLTPTFGTLFSTTHLKNPCHSPGGAPGRCEGALAATDTCACAQCR